MGLFSFRKAKDKSIDQNSIDTTTVMNIAKSAFDHGKFEEAAVHYRKAADSGNVVAMLNLADLFFYKKVQSSQDEDHKLTTAIYSK